MTDAPRLHPWSLVYDRFDPRHEGTREALCALGNGCLVTRGAAPWVTADGTHYPGTYRAGCYDHRVSVVDGAPLSHEDLVNLPNWLRVDLELAGAAFDLRRLEQLEYRQELDLRVGVLTRDVRGVLAGRRVRLRERRLVSMATPQLAALELTLELDDGGDVAVRSWLDGQVGNYNVEEYRGTDGPHLADFATAELAEGVVGLRARTGGTRVEVALAARTRVRVDDEPLTGLRAVADRPDAIAATAACTLPPGGRLVLEKVVALHTGRDVGVRTPDEAAAIAVAEAGAFADLLADHTRAWADLWAGFDTLVDGMPETTAALRLHLFHILQTASPHAAALDVGVPGRGWHGEGYRGHVFWDELFVVPVLAYRQPESVRSLLLYRYWRLPAARRAARAAGLRGAMFPWRSASDGRDVTEARRLNPRSGRWIRDNSNLQRHVAAAVAYNVWRYHEITGDLEFLATHGAEMLVEIARLWASLAAFDESRGRYVIRGVVGPDEFHDAYPGAERPGLDNNAYTNVMAVWSILRAEEALRRLPAGARDELVRRLDLADDERRGWHDITRRMFVPFHDDVISQFEGYADLPEFDWDGYRARYGDIHRLDDILEAEGGSPNGYKLSKQADVVMLFYALTAAELREIFTDLGYAWDDQLIARNTRYYADRTSHGSTLSRVVYAWVLSHCCDRTDSWKILCEALGSDLRDIQGGTTAEGIHIGAMAGTVDIFQRCYTGLDARDDALWLDPGLPGDLRRVAFRIRYRGAWIDLDVASDRVGVRVAADAPAPVPLRIAGRCERLLPGSSHTFAVDCRAVAGCGS